MRLIDADALTEKYGDWYTEEGTEEGYIGTIRGIVESAPTIYDAPAAQPEIIRCKDCKHRPIATRADDGILWGFSVEFPDEICPLQCGDEWYNYYPKDDFYCANAERRTDG